MGTLAHMGSVERLSGSCDPTGENFHLICTHSPLAKVSTAFNCEGREQAVVGSISNPVTVTKTNHRPLSHGITLAADIPTQYLHSSLLQNYSMVRSAATLCYLMC